MHIRAFSVNNFRSIVSTGWVSMSPDDVTCIVGMNESGKTSLLEALHCALGAQKLTKLDVRFGSALPTLSIRFELDKTEWNGLCTDWPPQKKRVVRDFFAQSGGKYEVNFNWSKQEGKYECSRTLTISDLGILLIDSDDDKTAIAPESPASTSDDDEQPVVYFDLLSDALENLEPITILFSDERGLLPDNVDVPVNNSLSGNGAQGANNFLKVAGIDLAQLNAGTDADRANLLGRATKRITNDFQEFWTQNIGTNQRLELECEIKQKRADSGAEAGHPYLQFWITDGDNRLRPSQRSKGLRWFLSFFLQLRALGLGKGGARIFLLDEPGANLHETAQRDVLKLINEIRPSICCVAYTTHSPHLVEIDRLYRILTVERASDGSESPSLVKNALSNASSAGRETLSPIYAKMGVDFWRQTVIDKKHNVLLEEPSGYFYIKAFWRLLNIAEKPSFIACTGVNNIPQLALMFAGWGLGFIVVVDDDNSGRGVFKELKQNLFGNDDSLTRNRVLKIAECEGIEDIFSASDFRRLVLKTEKSYIEKTTKYLKSTGLSKPLLACQFLLSVDAEEISMDSLDSESKHRIAALVEEIRIRLN